MDFHTMYQRYAADVNRFVLYLSGDASVAEDITSEAFVQAWTAPANIRTATVKAYLFTIARNVYLQMLRKDWRLTEVDDQIADPTPDPLERASDSEELEHVLEDLQELPEVDRAALLMRARDELSYQEIAHILGITSASVRVKVHRTRIKLNQLRQSKEDRK